MNAFTAGARAKRESRKCKRNSEVDEWRAIQSLRKSPNCLESMAERIHNGDVGGDARLAHELESTRSVGFWIQQ
jgi:hypothetical protein